MLELSRQQGVSIVVATPHFYPLREQIEKFLQRREKAMAAVAYQQDTMPQLLLGAEVAYFRGIGTCSQLDRLCLGDSRLLLLEMPYTPWTNQMVDEVCKLQRQGVLPVLAHIERYYKRDQFLKYKDELLEWGICFQASAAGFVDRKTAGRTLKLLQNGQMHFVGSDCHNMAQRKPNLDQAGQIIYHRLGPEAIRWLDRLADELLVQGVYF